MFSSQGPWPPPWAALPLTMRLSNRVRGTWAQQVKARWVLLPGSIPALHPGHFQVFGGGGGALPLKFLSKAPGT